MTDSKSKLPGFACQQCRASKRRCDGVEPQCSYCKKTDKACVYVKETKPRKRKYWDEAYVKSLEDQVQTLLALQNQTKNTSKPESSELPASNTGNSTPRHPKPSLQHAFDEHQIQNGGESSQSRQAMEELSVMMWRTNLADGVTIDSEPGSTPPQETSIDRRQSPRLNTPRQISDYGRDPERIHRLANLFLNHINQEHQFTRYGTSEVFSTFPNHPPDLLFLHAAMLAVGATFEGQPDSLALSDEFSELSESLVFTCFRHAPSIYVIQGLSILSWRSLALGHDHLGWTFLSMAAGMAVHLRLHVLALDEFATESVRPSLETVQTFWSFYMTDRTSISILGRNCILPWRRVNVPAIETFFHDGKGDLSQISFAWQCKLWYMHDRNMDQIFSSSFEKESLSDQVRMLISTHKDLSNFFKSRDERLEITRDTAPKAVLLFHMAYQMAILITMPPFLRLFASLKTEKGQISQALSLVLRSITSAAASMVRLVQRYCKTHGFEHANPLLIHHLLSASIVHLMNATATSPSFRGHSTRLLRCCLNLLQGLGSYWSLRSRKSIDTIKALARRWKVEFTLILEDEENDNIQNTSHRQTDNPSESFGHDTQLAPITNLNPAMFNIGYEGYDDHFDVLFDTEQMESHPERNFGGPFDISMVNIPTSGQDELFGLTDFFQTFENYPDLFSVHQS